MGMRWLGGAADVAETRKSSEKSASPAKSRCTRNPKGGGQLIQRIKSTNNIVFCMKWVTIGGLEAVVARVSMEFRPGSVGRGLGAKKYRESAGPLWATRL